MIKFLLVKGNLLSSITESVESNKSYICHGKDKKKQ